MYFNGDYELLTVLKDDDETLEYIGYVYDYHHEPKFIVRYWIGYHEDGELIFTGKFEIKKGGVGWPMIKHPNNYNANEKNKPEIKYISWIDVENIR